MKTLKEWKPKEPLKGDPETDLPKFLSAGFTKTPVVEYVDWRVSFPLLQPDHFFEDRISLLRTSGTEGGVTIDSSFVLNGILQSNLLVVGVGLDLDGETTTFSCEDDQGQTLEWGKSTWDAARALVDGYSIQMTLQQRWLLLNEPLAALARVGSRQEPIQRLEGVPDAYIERVNKGREACMQCGTIVSKKVFGTSTRQLVPMVTDSRYSDRGPRRLQRPCLLEMGIPIGVHLIMEDESSQSIARRAASHEETFFKGGTLALRFSLYGWEVDKTWMQYLVASGSKLGIDMPTIKTR